LADYDQRWRARATSKSHSGHGKLRSRSSCRADGEKEVVERVLADEAVRKFVDASRSKKSLRARSAGELSSKEFRDQIADQIATAATPMPITNMSTPLRRTPA